MAKPVVAIVGRPNVGKSTLFNHLIGKRKAIVEDVPGVTRDRLYDNTDWAGREFIIIDTGGIRFEEGDIFAREVKLQAELAIEEADVIIFVLDAQQGLSTEDEQVADILRRSGKPVVLAANKVENFDRQLDYYEFYNLGLGEPMGISSGQALGLGDLLDEIIKNLSPEEEEVYDEYTIKVAVVGKPNVGKSSLVNKILGEQRVIVSDVPGTTRDAIDTPFTMGEGKYVFIDTAGMRKRGKVFESIERYSVIRSLTAIERADVCLMLIDGKEGVSEQDSKIAGYIHDQGKAAVIIVNKWDIVEKDDKTVDKYKADIRNELSFMEYAPILFISALTGQRVNKVLGLVNHVSNQHAMRVSTGMLNDVINEAVLTNQPTVSGGRRLKILYAAQVSIKPPTFALFVNEPSLMHFSYQRYLENQIRKAFGFEGTPVRFLLRERE